MFLPRADPQHDFFCALEQIRKLKEIYDLWCNNLNKHISFKSKQFMLLYYIVIIDVNELSVFHLFIKKEDI